MRDAGNDDGPRGGHRFTSTTLLRDYKPVGTVNWIAASQVDAEHVAEPFLSRFVRLT
jgi:hypothetical protein